MAKKPAATKSKTTGKSKTSKRTSSSTSKPSPKGRKSKPRAAKPKLSKPTQPGDEEVPVDRRRQADRRSETSCGKPPGNIERRQKVQRRRQIDPTTCERDYTEQEIEFMNAMDEYKRTSGRMFPTCSEVLEVIHNLGYVQLSPAELAARGSENQESGTASAEEDNPEAAFETAGTSDSHF